MAILARSAVLMAVAMHTLEKEEPNLYYSDHPAFVLEKIHRTPEEKIRERAHRLAKYHSRLAILTQVLAVVILVIMSFFKEAVHYHIAGLELHLLDSFFALDGWIQWTVVCVINVWAIFELVLTKSLRQILELESPTRLKVWLAVDFLDWFVLGTCFGLLLIFTGMKVTLMLGLAINLIILYEICFVYTLCQFIKVVSGTYHDNEAETGQSQSIPPPQYGQNLYDTSQSQKATP